MMRHALTVLLLAAFLWAAWPAATAQALEYPYAPYNDGKMDPQKTGWPLTEEERIHVRHRLITRTCTAKQHFSVFR